MLSRAQQGHSSMLVNNLVLRKQLSVVLIIGVCMLPSPLWRQSPGLRPGALEEVPPLPAKERRQHGHEHGHGHGEVDAGIGVVLTVGDGDGADCTDGGAADNDAEEADAGLYCSANARRAAHLACRAAWRHSLGSAADMEVAHNDRRQSAKVGTHGQVMPEHRAAAALEFKVSICLSAIQHEYRATPT